MLPVNPIVPVGVQCGPNIYRPEHMTTAKPQKQESLLLNLAFNIVIPTLILTRMSSDERLGTTLALVIALAFPLLYGGAYLIRRGRINFFSALGFVSVLLTGAIGLLALSPQLVAVKEAAIPAIFGLATLISLKTRWPVVRTLIYNDKVMDIEKVSMALIRNGTQSQFERHLRAVSWLIAASFFLSAVLNYILASMVVQSDPGTVAFNTELGRMTALSFPVIAVPATLVMIGAMLYLFRGIRQLTGLNLDDILHLPQSSKE